MSIFCFKKLQPAERICHRFKKLREQKKISLEEANAATHIPKEHITAIEECRFSDLPATKAHRIAYLKKYSEFLGIDSKHSLNKFENEDGLKGVQVDNPKIAKNIKPGIISIWLRNVALILLVLIFSAYAIWQVKGILEPPKLEVYSPPEGFVTQSLNVIVEGNTNKENKVTVNGKEIMVNEEGHFSNKIDLSKGINTINIVASKKHGKTTEITRNIIVKN